VLTDVTTDMAITKEETFGPVAPLYRSCRPSIGVRLHRPGGQQKPRRDAQVCA
jgi:hypothetical protein